MFKLACLLRSGWRASVAAGLRIQTHCVIVIFENDERCRLTFQNTNFLLKFICFWLRPYHWGSWTYTLSFRRKLFDNSSFTEYVLRILELCSVEWIEWLNRFFWLRKLVGLLSDCCANHRSAGQHLKKTLFAELEIQKDQKYICTAFRNAIFVIQFWGQAFATGALARALSCTAVYHWMIPVYEVCLVNKIICVESVEQLNFNFDDRIVIFRLVTDFGLTHEMIDRVLNSSFIEQPRGEATGTNDRPSYVHLLGRG